LIPPHIAAAVEHHLGSPQGLNARITSARPVGGGCVNRCARIETDRRAVFFLKWNEQAPAEMFASEADGLRALRAAGLAHGMRVPEVVAIGSEEPAQSSTSTRPVEASRWLLMEYIERAAGGRDYGRTLGSALAGLHGDSGQLPDWSPADVSVPRPTPEGTMAPQAFGWHRDNFIGPLPQTNAFSDDWAAFWRDARLAPQVSLARERRSLTGDDSRQLDRLLDRTGEALAGAEADGPSLLHGDLWSGNVYADETGQPVLIDPAVYIGHREVDLAMSELFGGFPAGYLDAYREAHPLDEGYRRIRRPLYQLYYLLIHVNLFGESYLSGVRGVVREVLQGL
jgi:fructosamine-3-kinase